MRINYAVTTTIIPMIVVAGLLAGCDGRPRASAPQPTTQSSSVTAAHDAPPSGIDKLKGAYCYAADAAGEKGDKAVCQRQVGERSRDDAEATKIFLRLFWSKLDSKLQADALERMQTVAPFEENTPGIVTGGGCIPHECDSDTVDFYFERSSGRVALAITRDSECRTYVEAGFTHKEVLCR